MYVIVSVSRRQMSLIGQAINFDRFVHYKKLYITYHVYQRIGKTVSFRI